jgi:hypothetical protein
MEVDMFRLLFAVLVFWALSTSGLRAGDVAHALAVWTADHVEINVRTPEGHGVRDLGDLRRDGALELGPFTLRASD